MSDKYQPYLATPLERLLQSQRGIITGFVELMLKARVDSLNDGTYEEIYGAKKCEREERKLRELHAAVGKYNGQEVVVVECWQRTEEEKFDPARGRLTLGNLEEEVDKIKRLSYNARVETEYYYKMDRFSRTCPLNGNGVRVDKVLSATGEVLYDNPDKGYNPYGGTTSDICLELKRWAGR